MLNLSDKELDRFSKEAAQEYEPGDVLGPRSWDRLEVRINQEFGHPGWNPIGHIRRFPFIYAPALLMVLGVVYYLVRPGVSSGSSPGGTAKASTQKTSVQTQNSVSTDKATSTPATSSETTSIPPAGKGGNGKAIAGGADAGNAAPAEGVSASVTSGRSGNRNSNLGRNNGSGANGGRNNKKDVRLAGDNTVAVMVPLNSGRGQMGAKGNVRGRIGNGAVASTTAGNTSGSRNPAGASGKTAGTAGGTGTTGQQRELSLSNVQRPRSLGRRNAINDSLLRAFNAKSNAPTLIKKKGIYRINRNWQFGLMVAPDFTSVKSLAGDKAGSSIGLTVDYQFAPHWYISSGVLATRKNYAARTQDYHAPPNYFQSRGIYGYVDYVKGSFYMMEIPLSLRYDFTVSGSTLFFASGGVSSYLMTSEKRKK